MRIAGAILAGGRSTRMGADKAFVPLAGKPLVGWSAARLKPQVAELAVNANGSDPRLEALGLPVLRDSVPGFPGPLAGILAGLDWAAGSCDAVVTVAVDTPFFPLHLVDALAAAPGGGAAAAASGGRVHPVFALWPCALRQPLRAFIASGETGRVMTFLERCGFKTVDFPLAASHSGPFDPFFNVNTPADLEFAEENAAEAFAA